MNDDWWSLPFGFLIFTSIHYPLLKVAHPFLVDLTLSQDILSLSLSLSPLFLESHLAIYKIYPCWCEEHDLARIFFVMCAMDCGSSLPMNFDIVILKMPNDWTDNTYTHSFLCLKTDLWSKNNSSNCPTFPKLLFFTPCFWCCCGAYIYIYRSCHGDRGLPGTRYITSIIIQRSQVWDLLTGGGNRSGWGA